MTITYRTHQVPADVLITSVHCAICKRFVMTGNYTIAPAASVHAGKPICAECIDMVPMTRGGMVTGGAQVGPSETKTAGEEGDGTGWYDS